jgi:uncharacterized protein
MKTLEEVKLEIQALKPVLNERFKVETVDIFGSFSRGEQTKNSDLDLLVTYSESVDLLLVSSLRRYLRRKLHVKVNVVSKEFLNKHIRNQVLEEAVAV